VGHRVKEGERRGCGRSGSHHGTGGGWQLDVVRRCAEIVAAAARGRRGGGGVRRAGQAVRTRPKGVAGWAGQAGAREMTGWAIPEVGPGQNPRRKRKSI
jgi:hypothetical protein